MKDLQKLLAQAGHLDEGHLPIFVFAWESLVLGHRDGLPQMGILFGDRADIDRKITKVFGTLGLEHFQDKLETLCPGRMYSIEHVWGFAFALLRVG